MSRTIEFYFDFGSPTAYLAFTQLPHIAAETGAELVYKPVLLGGIFKATHNASPMMIPAKGSYVMRDLVRFAKRFDVPLNFNPFFPINTLTLMRIARGLQLGQPESFIRYVSAIYQATWVNGLNVGDLTVLHEVLEAEGLDADTLIQLAGDPEVKQLLLEDTERAVQRGLFGLPVMFVGDEMFWGQDRLDFVRETLMSVTDSPAA